MNHSSSGLIPLLSHHIYWDHKTKFQFNVDIYEHWVLFAVEGGSFSYRIGEAEGTAKMGDVIVCPPELSFHRSVMHTLSFHFIGFSFCSVSDEQGKQNEVEESVRLRLAASSYKLTISQRERLADNLRFLKEHPEKETNLKRHWQNHALSDIWRYCQSTEAPSSDKVIPPKDPLIEQAKLFIEQNGFGELSMLELAAELGISPVQLSRRFSKSEGMNPSYYLAQLRLEKVKELLMDTDLPLEKIAVACGYSNGFYLSRVFTKALKTSPSAYRKTNRV